jgi:uncharacterized membrane protein YkvA (DUF1232 family)
MTMKKPGFIAFWKQKAGELKLQTYALYFAYRDPRVRWYAKAFIGLIVAYAFSPIDLIPDFIPILGYVDDLILIPLGVFLALKMIPAPVMEESRAKAKDHLRGEKPQYKFMGAVIIGIWILVVLAVGIVLISGIR